MNLKFPFVVCVKFLKNRKIKQKQKRLFLQRTQGNNSRNTVHYSNFKLLFYCHLYVCNLFTFLIPILFLATLCCDIIFVPSNYFLILFQFKRGCLIILLLLINPHHF
jgi:hypothetical protein